MAARPPNHDDDDDGTFDDWEEDEDCGDDDDAPVRSLFSDAVFPSIKDMIAHDRATFGFDLRDAAGAVHFDDIGLIMLVNFVRRRVRDRGVASAATAVDAVFVDAVKAEVATGAFLRDDTNMQPVLPDDSLLFLLRDALVKDGVVPEEDDDEVEAREAQAAVAAAQQQTGVSAGAPAGGSSAADDMLKKYQAMVAALTAEPDLKTDPDDEYYFTGYSHISIHETMLRDHPRTSAYAQALEANGAFMKGKVVLDVGCGTGILCLLAARAGAKKVIGVDLSSIIGRAQKVIDKNGYGDVITLVRGRLEEVKLPLAAGEEVDVIVSEWMGYGLYFENMLTSVLHARDEYLAADGVLMPSAAEVYIEAMTATGSDDRVAWWGDVYGFDMSDMADLLSNEAQVQLVDPELVISDRGIAHTLLIRDASSADLDFETPFRLVISRPSDLRAFVISFDVVFAAAAFAKQVTLTTGVAAEPTHWKQTALWLTPDNSAPVQAGDVVAGVLKYVRGANNARDYTVAVTWRIHPGGAADSSDERSQSFLLAS